MKNREMKNILFIEDEVLLLNAVEVMLTANGFGVFSAETGEQALKILSERSDEIDLVLCDINLPDIDGYEVLHAVRKNEKLFASPFIFLTAYADEKDVRTGMNAGADDYLTKPFKMKDLVRTIESRLDIRKRANEQHKAELKKEMAVIMNENFRQEFFTPLNSILNASYLLQNEDSILDKATLHDCMKGIYEAGFRMFRSARNLILYSSIEHKQVLEPIKLQSKNINTILHDTIKYYFVDHANYNKVIDLKAENTEIASNQGEYLSVIFTELIDNAVYFGYEGQRPEVTLEETKDGLLFSVTNCIAHPTSFSLKDVAPFKKFHDDQSYTGLGLGLFICKKLCKIIGCDLRMKTTDSTICFQVVIKNDVNS